MSHAITQSPITSTSNAGTKGRSAGWLVAVFGMVLTGLVGCTTSVVDDNEADDPVVQEEDPTTSGGTKTLECGAEALYFESHDTCGAMDAIAVGDEAGHCNCMLGFAWDGAGCTALADCQCEGDDCDKLTLTMEECEAAHVDCADSAPQGLACGDPNLTMAVHDICEPMDAVGAPDENGSGCFCALGYAWDGAECVMLGNCQCVGADCDKLTETPEECEAAHAICS